MMGTRILFTIAILLLLFISICIGSYPAFCLLGILIGLLVCNLLTLFLCRFCLTLQLTCKEQWKHGEDGAFAILSIKNHSIFPLLYVRPEIRTEYLRSLEMSDHRKPCSIAGCSTVSYPIPVNTSHCGKQQIQCPTVTIMDCFHLFHFSIKTDCCTSCYVNPIPSAFTIVMADQALSSRGNYSGYLTSSGSMTEMSDIRPYQDSDLMKHIHWKLSSKTESLLTKEYQSPRMTETALTIDTTFPDGVSISMDEQDQFLAYVASSLYSFVASYPGFLVNYYNTNIKSVISIMITTREEVSSLMNELLSMPFIPVSPELITGLLHGQMDHWNQRSIYFTYQDTFGAPSIQTISFANMNKTDNTLII